MTNPVVVIYDAETGETIEREMNSKELAQWQADQEAKAIIEAEAEAKAAQKAALLDRLGITEEEAKLLLA
jgi:hypothetical protein